MLPVHGTNLFIDADAAAGTVTIYRRARADFAPEAIQELTPLQTEELMRLLDKGRMIVYQGIGDMNPHLE